MLSIRQDPRVKRTRQLLQDALTSLLHQKQYGDISVQDITEQATINRATFYAHYQDKQDLLNSMIREQFRTALQQSLSPQASWNEESLAQLTQAVTDFFRGLNPAHCGSAQVMDPLLRKAAQEEIYETLLGWLRKTPPTGQGRPAAPETIALLTSWALFGAATAAEDMRQANYQPFLRDVLSVLTQGLTRLSPKLSPGN